MIQSLLYCTKTLVWVSLALFYLPLHGALVSYEGFNYNAGNFATGANTGVGWNSAWTVNASNRVPSSIVTSSLVGPAGSAPSSGGHLVAQGDSSKGGMVATIQYGTDFRFNMSQEGQVRYASMLISKSNIAAGGGEYIQMSLGNDVNGTQWLFGMSSEESFFLRSYDTAIKTNFASGTHFGANDSILLISKLVTSASGNDRIYLSWYKVDGTVPQIEPSNWMFSMALNAQSTTTLTTLSLETGNANQTEFHIDEIRLGTSWAAMIPEPSVSLLVLGGSSFVFLRRRRAL